MKKPTRSRVITESLGGSALSLAVQQQKLPNELQPWSPRSRAEWKAHVERVRSTANGWHETLGPALAASGVAARRLGRAAKTGVVVTTGQQAGLFGGPLYTLSKALTALALADAIEEECNVPAAPVFWAATDDADFLEASVAHVADADGHRAIGLTVKPPAGTPMAAAQLGDIQALLDQLRAACGSAAHANYFELARTTFTREKTLGGAYVAFLRGLLEPLGIAVLDSSHAACRSAARPVLLDALRRAADVARAGTARASAIRKAGHEPQVLDDRGLSLVFALENGVKRRLTVDEAGKMAAHAGGDLLPNVLLRPVVERALMPTVAYCAGPGELAYFAQTSAVAKALGREEPVGVARWSCTIVEPFAARALGRLHVQPNALAKRHDVERRLATSALPKDVDRAWNQLRKNVDGAVVALSKAVTKTKLMPAAVVEGLQRSLEHRMSRGERRLLAAAKRRDERVRQDVRVAADALFPNGERQERVLNYVPMLSRGGEQLLDDMRRAARTHVDALIRGRSKGGGRSR